MHPQKILSYSFLLVICCLGYTCVPKTITSLYQPPPDVPIAYEGPNNKPRQRGPCDLSENYIPDTNYLHHYPVKELQVNIHWMNSSGRQQQALPETKEAPDRSPGARGAAS